MHCKPTSVIHDQYITGPQSIGSAFDLSMQWRALHWEGRGSTLYRAVGAPSAVYMYVGKLIIILAKSVLYVQSLLAPPPDRKSVV